jgi:hypothetical protein
MGNSGWCLSKEVDYQTGEAYRSRNSEFTFNKSKIGVEKDIEQENCEEIMEKSTEKVDDSKLVSTKVDKEAKQVSNRAKNNNQLYFFIFCLSIKNV